LFWIELCIAWGAQALNINAAQSILLLMTPAALLDLVALTP
jgi:hypothetical protein